MLLKTPSVYSSTAENSPPENALLLQTDRAEVSTETFLFLLFSQTKI